MAYQWSVDIDEEALHRQGLFRKARKGDKKLNRNYRRRMACDYSLSRNGPNWSIPHLSRRPNTGSGRLKYRERS